MKTFRGSILRNGICCTFNTEIYNKIYSQGWTQSHKFTFFMVSSLARLLMKVYKQEDLKILIKFVSLFHILYVFEWFFVFLFERAVCSCSSLFKDRTMLSRVSWDEFCFTVVKKILLDKKFDSVIACLVILVKKH